MSIGQIIYVSKTDNQISKEISLDESGVYFIEITIGTETVNKKIIVCD